MFLLRETDRSVTDICLDVGFTSLGTFSRTFRDIVGESPSGLSRGPRAAGGAELLPDDGDAADGRGRGTDEIEQFWRSHPRGETLG